MSETYLKEYFSRVQQGDKEAFAHIYNELKQPVFTIVCRIVQSKEIAEDVTHDVFVKLFVSPPDSSVRNPRAWIFQIARNLAIDALRKGQCIDIDDVDIADDEKPTVISCAGTLNQLSKDFPVLKERYCRYT